MAHTNAGSKKQALYTRWRRTTQNVAVTVVVFLTITLVRIFVYSIDINSALVSTLYNHFYRCLQLISWMCVNQCDGFGSFQRVLQEYLVSATHSLARRSLPASALPLLRMLPFMQHLQFADVKVCGQAFLPVDHFLILDRVTSYG